MIAACGVKVSKVEKSEPSDIAAAVARQRAERAEGLRKMGEEAARTRQAAPRRRQLPGPRPLSGSDYPRGRRPRLTVTVRPSRAICSALSAHLPENSITSVQKEDRTLAPVTAISA